MAKCKKCPAIDDEKLAICDEFYVFGPGCPDQDFDCYGGECYGIATQNDIYEEEEGFEEFGVSA